MREKSQNNGEIEINIGELLLIFFEKKWMILASGIVCALVAIFITRYVMSPEYESDTKIYVISQQGAMSTEGLQTSSYLAKDYAELIKSRTVSEGVLKKMDLEMSSDELLSKIRVSTKSDTRVVTIIITDEDPKRAQALADAVREVSVEQIKYVMNLQDVNLVDPANLPDKPSSPSLMKNALIGAMVGCVLTLSIIFCLYLFNDTIQTPADVEKYLKISVLGDIPLGENAAKKKVRKRFWKA